jgi:predicted GNAT superfamily acetyltransferase
MRTENTRMDQIEDLNIAALPDEGPPSTWLALNNAHAEQLSYLTAERLHKLVAEAFMAAKIGAGDALLIAFDQQANYDSENFLWFKRKFDRFVYVDRVVVSPAARGRGLARALYSSLFKRAEFAGHERIVCEINLSPSNPASDSFHAALGFQEIGSATIASGKKTVRYFSRPVSPISPQQ